MSVLWDSLKFLKKARRVLIFWRRRSNSSLASEKCSITTNFIDLPLCLWLCTLPLKASYTYLHFFWLMRESCHFYRPLNVECWKLNLCFSFSFSFQLQSPLDWKEELITYKGCLSSKDIKRQHSQKVPQNAKVSLD